MVGREEPVFSRGPDFLSLSFPLPVVPAKSILLGEDGATLNLKKEKN